MANVLLFGPLADVLDTSSIEVELGEQIQTTNDLINELAQKNA